MSNTAILFNQKPNNAALSYAMSYVRISGIQPDHRKLNGDSRACAEILLRDIKSTNEKQFIMEFRLLWAHIIGGCMIPQGGELSLIKSTRKAMIVGMMLLFFTILVLSGILTKGTPNTPDALQYLRGWETNVADKADDAYYKEEKQSYILEMSHELSNNMCGKVISFRTNDSFVDAFFLSADGQSAKIYHFGEQPRFGSSPGTYTHFIEMPESGSGRILIRIETAYKNKFLTEYDVAIGSKNELIFGYLRSEAAAVIPNILLIIFGSILFIVYIVSLGMHRPVPEALSLSILTIIFTIYANCPLFANQCIFQNAITQYYLNYFTLYLSPLLAILYFEDIVPELNMKWLFYGLCTLSTALTALHFLGIADYTKTIKIYIAALALFALISFVMIAAKFKKMTSLNRIALLTMLFFILINTLFFIFISTLGNQSFLTKIGLLLYIFIAIVNGLNKLMEGFFKKREDELLHEIAYTDNLTQLGNRYALERDVQKMSLESVSIVSLDLNYLKYTNDTFGHSGGDVLLKAAAACISSVYDKVYRVGGDEFIALVEQTDHTVLDSFADHLQKKIMQFNQERTHFEAFAEHEDFVLSIAAGYASHQVNDNSYEQIMNRADEKMYTIKKRIHAENGKTPIQKTAVNH